MRFCSWAGVMAVVAPFALQGAQESARKITLVVRADSHSGRLVRSVSVASRAVPERVLKPLTPRQDAPEVERAALAIPEMVETAARRHQLDPLLVHSVIRAESNYNPYALSPKGAQGLMQLIPATARRFGVANAFNPAQNIEGGVRYLKYLLALYGDYPRALAAYNAGEAAVDRYRGIPPYAETRSYVYQVGKNLGAARRAAERRAPAMSENPAPSLQKVVDTQGREYYRNR